ncbi:MAG: exosortase/archaeosortase family protein [Thermoplasmatota archaeon]
MRPKTSTICLIVGLLLLGEASFVLLELGPHEPFWLGLLALIGGGAALSFAQLPTFPRIPRAIPIGVGAVAGATVLLYVEAGHVWDLAKASLVVLSAGTILLGALTARAWARRALVVSVPALWVPLGFWAVQGFFKTADGSTPLEAFIHYGLLIPLSAAVAAVGWSPSIQGDIITFATPRGPFSLEVGFACSGIQAMGMFGGILGLLMLFEPPKTLAGFAWAGVGFLGVYVSNLLRLFVLVAVGRAWGADALETVHANAGWMFFVAWAGVFAWIWTRSPGGARVTDRETRATAPVKG